MLLIIALISVLLLLIILFVIKLRLEFVLDYSSLGVIKIDIGNSCRFLAASMELNHQDVFKLISDRFLANKPQRQIKINAPKFLKKVAGQIVFTSISCQAKIGTSNAMHTALLTGLSYSISYTVLAFIQRKRALKIGEMRFIPDFNRSVIECRIVCIFKVNLVHIILIIFFAKQLKHKLDEAI